MVSERDALEVLSMFEDAAIKIFLDGGWGIDALVGYESRQHNDIDVFIEDCDKLKALNALMKAGYVEMIMDYTTLNHTVWHDKNDRIIDLHFFTYDCNRNLIFEGETYPSDVFSGKGHICHKDIACIAPDYQLQFHSGYELDENDIKDVVLLCETFNLGIPVEISNRISLNNR